MMKARKYSNQSRLLFVIVVIMTIASCSSKKAFDEIRLRLTEEKGAIPPEFGKEGTVLVCIMKGRNGYDDGIKRAAEKYLGEKIFIAEADLYSDSYADKSKYRFVFDHELGRTKASAINETKIFYIYDRLTSKMHRSNVNSWGFGQIAEIYMTHLEEKRMSHLAR